MITVTENDSQKKRCVKLKKFSVMVQQCQLAVTT
jgi:hypothetical protein